MKRKLIIALLMLTLSAQPSFGCDDGIEYHTFGNAWQVQDFSNRVYSELARESEAELESLEAEAQLTDEEKELCEEACRAEVCSCETPVDYIGEFKAYAYCTCTECCDAEWNGLTFTETIPVEGRTVAVDPEVVPLGSILAIEYPDGSYRELIAEDTGAGIKGNTLDVFIEDHERALEHGVQTVKVYKEK